jgi:HlyD family secretion protein
MKALLFSCFIFPGLVALSCGRRVSSPGGAGLIEATVVDISSQAAGQLKMMHFDEGQDIAMGDTIGIIDTVTVMLNLRQAQAAETAAETRLLMASIAIKQSTYNLDLAGKEYERISALIKSGSANQQQFDQAETAFKQAALGREQADASLRAAQADVNQTKAQFALFQKQFDDCFPISPLNGIIVEKYIEPGELLTIGKPIIKIARLDTVWVKVYLSPADLARISLGGQAKVDPEDGSHAPLDGSVSWISDQAEFTPKNVQTKEARADLVYAVKVIVPNPDRILKIGMPASVRINTSH